MVNIFPSSFLSGQKWSAIGQLFSTGKREISLPKAELYIRDDPPFFGVSKHITLLLEGESFTKRFALFLFVSEVCVSF